MLYIKGDTRAKLPYSADQLDDPGRDGGGTGRGRLPPAAGHHPLAEQAHGERLEHRGEPEYKWRLQGHGVYKQDADANVHSKEAYKDTEAVSEPPAEGVPDEDDPPPALMDSGSLTTLGA